MGVALLMVMPSPNPARLAPQHCTVPVSERVQVCPPPAAIMGVAAPADKLKKRDTRIEKNNLQINWRINIAITFFVLIEVFYAFK
jgi:hypothetical protein